MCLICSLNIGTLQKVEPCMCHCLQCLIIISLEYSLCFFTDFISNNIIYRDCSQIPAAKAVWQQSTRAGRASLSLQWHGGPSRRLFQLSHFCIESCCSCHLTALANSIYFAIKNLELNVPMHTSGAYIMSVFIPTSTLARMTQDLE